MRAILCIKVPTNCDSTVKMLVQNFVNMPNLGHQFVIRTKSLNLDWGHHCRGCPKSTQVDSQVWSEFIDHLTESTIIKSWSNLGVDNQSHQSETISFSPSHQVIQSRSSQDQIRSKGISHSSLPFILVKFHFSQFRDSDKMHKKSASGRRRDTTNGQRKDGKGIPPKGSLTNPACMHASSTHNDSRVRKQNTGCQGSKPVITMVGFKL